MTLSLETVPDESMFRVEPVAPLPGGPTRRERWTTAIEVALALLFNLVFLFALFVHLPVTPPPQRKEPPSIPIQLVKPQQAPPRPKLQEQPKPKPQEQKKEQPKPQEQPKPPEPKKEQPKPKEEPKPKPQQIHRESGGKEANKAPGTPPKVKAEKAPKPPQVEVKKAPQAPKSEVALPDWVKKLAPGYDLPPAKMTRSAKASSSDDDSPKSDHPGEGGGDPYLNAMRDQVNANLRYPPEAGGARGVVVFLIQVSRDGSIASMMLQRSSGVQSLDIAAEAAIRRSNPFRPLPSDYPDPTYVTAAIPVQP